MVKIQSTNKPNGGRRESEVKQNTDTPEVNKVITNQQSTRKGSKSWSPLVNANSDLFNRDKQETEKDNL